MVGLDFVFAHGKRVCTFESEDVANFVLVLNGLRKLNGTDSTEAREKISYRLQFLRVRLILSLVTEKSSFTAKVCTGIIERY